MRDARLIYKKLLRYSIMVSVKNGGHVCDECQLVYDERQWAEKCEEWCSAHHTCNIAITKHAKKTG